jgi:hypothetical protein
MDSNPTATNSLEQNESIYSNKMPSSNITPPPLSVSALKNFGKRVSSIKNKGFLRGKKKSLKLEEKKPTNLAKTGLLGKIGKFDRKLIFYTDLEDDNDLMREFLLKDLKELTEDDTLKPFPDFGFNNELHFIKTEGLTP